MEPSTNEQKRARQSAPVWLKLAVQQHALVNWQKRKSNLNEFQLWQQKLKEQPTALWTNAPKKAKQLPHAWLKHVLHVEV
ncbi:MAG: hypothetical protein MJZ90_00715 [Bacteroidales bacterium]|nr:hypothetical protein [Bacteroidales bacterium]